MPRNVGVRGKPVIVRERPERQVALDLKTIDGMASVGATNVEIADFLGVSESLIRKRCKSVLDKARSGLRTRLRQAQLKTALGGNPAMLIWLGKQMLDQKERTEAAAVDPAAMALAIREAIRSSDRAEGLAE